MKSLIFSQAAAARLIKIATKIEAIRVFSGSIQVTYRTSNGRCSTFVSKKDFYNDFVNFRREGAKLVTVRRWGAGGSFQNHYECKSASSKRYHTVKLLGGKVICDCEDYKQQKAELGSATCKHMYATLNHLGHSSVEEYLKAVSNRAKADLFGGGWDAPRIGLEVTSSPQVGASPEEHLVEPHGDFIDDVNQEFQPVALTQKKKAPRDPFGGFNF